MRFFSLLLLPVLFLQISGWETDLEQAKKEASREHKLILLNFSGSDWCIPCIRLRSEVFEQSAFTGFAEQQLVLVNADFPRLRKNQLAKEQQKKNDRLADQYNPEGIFPLTLLLNAKGEVIKTWEGYPNLSPEEFIQEIKSMSNGRN